VRKVLVGGHLATVRSDRSASVQRVLIRGLRAERARIGLSQEALADRLGWSRQKITKIENMTTRLYADELPELLDALGITLGKLVQDATADDRRALGQ
jgi:transcriptional regulator with XRE-family HTH domain